MAPSDQNWTFLTPYFGKITVYRILSGIITQEEMIKYFTTVFVFGLQVNFKSEQRRPTFATPFCLRLSIFAGHYFHFPITYNNSLIISKILIKITIKCSFWMLMNQMRPIVNKIPKTGCKLFIQEEDLWSGIFLWQFYIIVWHFPIVQCENLIYEAGTFFSRILP